MLGCLKKFFHKEDGCCGCNWYIYTYNMIYIYIIYDIIYDIYILYIIYNMNTNTVLSKSNDNQTIKNPLQ